MPQFDFSTYSSQIFWFILCFVVFYYFVSTKILPRIAKILEERKDNIQANLNKSEALNKDLTKINDEARGLKDGALSEYKSNIEKVKQDLKSEREKAIVDLKHNIEEINKNSKEQIAKFLDSSKDDFDKSVRVIVDVIVKKITKNN